MQRFKKITTLAIAFFIAIYSMMGFMSGVLYSTVHAQSEPVKKIMPLGDSITEGDSGLATYRYYLWQNLLNGGCVTNFVGTKYGVRTGNPLFPNFDQNHEGYWGWRADQILGIISGSATQVVPDMVLMHLGTNDMIQGQTVASTITELGQIIDALRAVNPNVTVLLAQVIPAKNYMTQMQALNAQIPSLVSSKNTVESPVVLVDQWTGFDAVTDTYDGVHPNTTGQQKMATKWYNALTTVLATPTVVPVPADTQAPSVTVTSPTNGQQVLKGSTITLTAEASDNLNADRVEFYVNNSLVCKDTVAPFLCSWKAPNKTGNNTLVVKAFDAANNVGSSAPVTISVVSSLTNRR